MLKDEIEGGKEKKEKKKLKSIELTHQTRNMSHETEVTIYKANHKKYIVENRRGKNIDWKKKQRKKHYYNE